MQFSFIALFAVFFRLMGGPSNNSNDSDDGNSGDCTTNRMIGHGCVIDARIRFEA